MTPRSLPLSPLAIMLRVAVWAAAAGAAAGLYGIYDPERDRGVTLYRGAGHTGDTYTFYTHHPTLPGNWSSLSQGGIWIYYSEESYRGQNVTVVFGEDMELDLGHPIRSVRYAGNSRGSVMPAVILYSEPWFSGEEYYVEVEEGAGDHDHVLIPNFRDLSNRARSLIAVGADWTVFPEENFVGWPCTCLRNTHFAVVPEFPDDEMLRASFYPQLQETLGTTVGSVAMNCGKKTPWKNKCGYLDDEAVHRSRCPVLSNTTPDPCV